MEIIMNNTEQWNQLGPLSESTTDFSNYYQDIGVYRAILEGEIDYIGKATELNNGGFRKRLRDYTRTSDSARNYPSGRLMYQHKDKLHIEILVFERTESSVAMIESRERQLIAEIAPKWNALDRQ